MRRALALLLMVLWGAEAFAGARAGPVIVPNATGGQVMYDLLRKPSARSYELVDGVPTVKDLLTVTSPRGNPVQMSSGRPVGVEGIAVGIASLLANVAGRAALPLAVATTLYDVYKSQGYGVGGQDSQPGEGGAVVADGGQGQRLQTIYCLDPGDRAHNCGSSPAEAAAGSLAIARAAVQCGWSGGGSTIVCGGTVCEGLGCKFSYYQTWGDGSCCAASGTYGPVLSTEVHDYVCPSHNLTTLTRVGTEPCASDDNRVALNESQLGAVARAASVASLLNALKALTDAQPASGSAPDSWDIPTTGPAALGGPTVAGDPQSILTRDPGGQPITIRRQETVGYSGDKYTWGWSETSTDPSGVETPGDSGTGAAPGDSVDQCSLHPDAIGCAKFGDPEAKDVPRETKNLAFEPVALDGGGCPADSAFSIFGHGYSFKMAPMCSAVSTYMRPIVLLLGAAAAVLIFVGGLRTG